MAVPIRFGSRDYRHGGGAINKVRGIYMFSIYMGKPALCGGAYCQRFATVQCDAAGAVRCGKCSTEFVPAPVSGSKGYGLFALYVAAQIVGAAIVLVFAHSVGAF